MGNRVGSRFFLHEKKMSLTIGIDPGWASCGVAVQQDGVVLDKFFFVPREQHVIAKAHGELCQAMKYLILELQKILKSVPGSIPSLYMERYVAYAGVTSEASEYILMFIGAIKYHFEALEYPVHMVRAIDWKPKVCKHLVRTKDFNNPYSSFDKKFSLLAARTLAGLDPKNKTLTDHEADAVCLSFLGEIDATKK